MRADEVRRQKHGRLTTFVRVAEVSSTPGEAISAPSPAGELRIVGPPRSREDACTRVREAALLVSGRPLSGYSLADLEALALDDRVTLRTLLEELQAAGLELVAEAPFERLRDPRRAVEEVNIAGLRLARLTIDRWPAGDRVALLRQVAALQRDVAVIRTFAPLPRITDAAAPSTGYEDVRQVALARLVLDTVPSIQVDWRRYGPKLAQVALTMGADDLDNVSPEGDLGQGPRRTPLEDVRRNIRAAGFEAVERDGRFDLVR